MKKSLSFILILGTIPTAWFSIGTSPASAFCVYNKTSATIYGRDSARDNNVAREFGNLWSKNLSPGDRDCCPGNNKECQNVSVRIGWGNVGKNGNRVCQVRVGASQALVVTNKGKRLFCKVNS